MTESTADPQTGFRRFVSRWISVDNASLAIGMVLVTSGAACWSAPAALLTSGSLVIGVTLARLLLDGRAR